MQMPLTLRLAYHSFRAVIRAGLLLLCAWLILIPASETEAQALGASTGEQYPLGLRPMRTAQIVVAVAPDPAYGLIALGLGPEFSPWMVKIIMQQMALGRVLPQGVSVQDRLQSDRDIDGPRFIQID